MNYIMTVIEQNKRHTKIKRQGQCNVVQRMKTRSQVKKDLDSNSEPILTTYNYR